MGRCDLQADARRAPLDDFPDGTLAHREVAASHVARRPAGDRPADDPRDGPFGKGWSAFVEADPEVDIVAMVVEDDRGCAGSRSSTRS